MNARSTKFAKLRIKSEKADALAIELSAYTVGRTEELMEPPGGTHTTTDLYSKLSADPTIFAKLRIKSEKADA